MTDDLLIGGTTVSESMESLLPPMKMYRLVRRGQLDMIIEAHAADIAGPNCISFTIFTVYAEHPIPLTSHLFVIEPGMEVHMVENTVPMRGGSKAAN